MLFPLQVGTGFYILRLYRVTARKADLLVATLRGGKYSEALSLSPSPTGRRLG